MNWTETWTDIVVAIIAFWGAMLSTVTFIKDLRKEKSKIRVKTSCCLLGCTDGSSQRKINVVAMNKGSVSVVLSSVHILMPDGRNYVQIDSPSSPRLPYELLPRQSYSHFFDLDNFKIVAKQRGYLGRIKITPWFSDQLDNKYWSKPCKIDVE